MSPLDASMLLRDGTTSDLQTGESAPTSTSKDGDGAKVIDLKKTGAMGIIVLMNLPAAPTAFADTLTAIVQVSDYESTDFKTVANFPILYALNRRLTVKTTTGYVEADIGQTVTGGDTSDAGVIRWYDTALETVGAVGDIIVSQVAADSDFDDVDEQLTGGTGVSNMQKASVLTEYLSYGNFALRVVTEKRYIRTSLTATGGSNFGAVVVGLTNGWDYPLAAQ